MLKIWECIDGGFKNYPDIYSFKDSNHQYSKEEILKYLSRPSYNYGHGIKFVINGIEIWVIMCDGFEWRLSNINGPIYQEAIKKLDLKGVGQRGNGNDFVMFHVSDRRFDMRNPLSTQDIEFILEDSNLQEYAKFVVENVMKLYSTYLESIESK